MLLRLLRLLVFAAAPVILVVSPARAAPEKVQYTGDAKPGTIVIQSGERSLYLITGKDQALKYPVGVGRTGQQWFGTTRIASKHIKPAWKPPVSLRGKRSPDFYIEGGSPKNPMGAAALVLVDNELAIHGTNNPGSIGGRCPRAASACTTGTSWTCTAASMSGRGWCLQSELPSQSASGSLKRFRSCAHMTLANVWGGSRCEPGVSPVPPKQGG